VSQSNTPRAKPKDVYFFACLNSLAAALNLLIILKEPSHTKEAIDNSHITINMKNTWCQNTLLIERQPFLSIENVSSILATILTNGKLEL
jgi:hypothetical protein